MWWFMEIRTAISLFLQRPLWIYRKKKISYLIFNSAHLDFLLDQSNDDCDVQIAVQWHAQNAENR